MVLWTLMMYAKLC